MKKIYLIINFFIIALFEGIPLKATLKSDLVELNDALRTLEIQLKIQPQAFQPCPVAQPTQRPKQRPQSAVFPKTILSQSEEKPVQPKLQPLTQTTFEGTSATKRPLRATSVYTPKKGEVEETELERIQRLRKERAEQRESRAKLIKPILVKPLKLSEKESLNASATLKGIITTVQRFYQIPENEQKQSAKKLNDQINTDLKQGALNINSDIDKTVLLKILQYVLNINPLLIETSLDTLRNAGIAQKDLYDLMVELYTKRVDFIEYEFALARQQGKKFRLTEGEKKDVQEGLEYPSAISTETQNAEILANKENDKLAEMFFKEIYAQQARLKKLLEGDSTQTKEEKEEFIQTLKDQGIDIVKAQERLEKEQPSAYCKYKTQEGCTPYRSLYETLNNITQMINSADPKEDTYIVKNIKNKLNALKAYTTDPNFCQVCFNEDAQEHLRDQKKYNEQFNTLFTFISRETQGDLSKELIDLVLDIKQVEDTRRYLIKKLGLTDFTNYFYENAESFDWNSEYKKYENEIIRMNQ